MSLSAALVSVLALATAGGQQPPQTPAAGPSDPQATVLDEVIVDGRSLREAVDDFVDEVIAPPVGRGPARWDRKVCVGVANLRREAAQALVDQVSAVALRAGLEPGEPGCSPNILVVAAGDGREMARALVEARPHVFRPSYAGAARSSLQLRLFQEREAAVRWWHVSVPVQDETGDIAVRLPGQPAPLVRQDGSRLTTRIRNDLRRAFVIIDLTRMDGVTFQQLGDYVGMVALAQIDPEAETRAYDTVLNLFDQPAHSPGLTDWDAAYLAALYDAELNRRAPSHQNGEVAGLMLRERREAEAQDLPAPQ